VIAGSRRSSSYVLSNDQPARPRTHKASFHMALCMPCSPVFTPSPPVGGNWCAASPHNTARPWTRRSAIVTLIRHSPTLFTSTSRPGHADRAAHPPPHPLGVPELANPLFRLHRNLAQPAAVRVQRLQHTGGVRVGDEEQHAPRVPRHGVRYRSGSNS